VTSSSAAHSAVAKLIMVKPALTIFSLMGLRAIRFNAIYAAERD